MTSPSAADKPVNQNFRLRNIVFLIVFLLLVLSIISHDSADYAVLNGDPDYVRNWIGPLGAWISGSAFLLFGIAVYPILAILLLAQVRTLLPFPLKRHDYSGAILMLVLGFSILFALDPESWQDLTNSLGIGRSGPEAAPLALSGGVIGAELASPPGGVPGLIRQTIGKIGTAVVAFALILPGLFLIFFEDWWPILSEKFVFVKTEKRKQRSEEKNPDGKDVPLPDAGELPPSPEKKHFSLWGWMTGRDLREKDASEPEKSISGKIIRYGDEDKSGAEEAPYRVLPPRPAGKTAGVAEYNREPASVSVRPRMPETLPRISPSVKVQPYAERDEHSSAGEARTWNCPDYMLPPVSLLDRHSDAKSEDTAYLEQSRERLQQTLDSFDVAGHVENIVVGPRVTRFEVLLDEGVEVGKVTRIQNNIAMKMEAESVRILAPIPGRDAVGIEVPNKVSSIVYIRSVMESAAWRESTKKIPIILGRDIEGRAVVTDLSKAPHLLIAGSTGSGKSVCMNTLITSLLFRFSPAELRLILVDPKIVEMAAYSTIPHLITPVVNDAKKVPLALRWCVREMEKRYIQLASARSKNISDFNRRPLPQEVQNDINGDPLPARLPYLVVIIDELADIMMTEARKDVETSICRIAQKGRAAGVHLVIATQTPRKDIITGVIKANLPVKIAFKVGTNLDSRVILDCSGAEKLLGMGDLLFNPPGASVLERLQMTLVTDLEIQKVVDFVSGQLEQHFNSDVLSENAETAPDTSEGEEGWDENGEASASPPPDPAVSKYLRPGDSDLMRQAIELIINEQQASTSFFQRRLGIGYNRSAELVDQLEKRSIISPPLGGGQKRRILICDGLDTAE